MSIDYRYNAEERIRVALADHDALNALVTAQIATAEATLALAEQQHIANLIAPKEGDYHEGLEEGIKVGRAGSGPRPITDEMVKAGADEFERDGHYISTAFAYRAAKMRIREERHPGVPGLQYSLIQRTKAGPWLLVPGSTVRESDSGVRDSDSEESEGKA